MLLHHGIAWHIGRPVGVTPTFRPFRNLLMFLQHQSNTPDTYTQVIRIGAYLALLEGLERVARAEQEELHRQRIVEKKEHQRIEQDEQNRAEGRDSR